MESTVNDLVKIVMTGNGNGTPSLQEKVRNLEREVKEMQDSSAVILARLEEIKSNSEFQRGREEEKKTQIEKREKLEKTRAGRLNLLIGALTVLIALMAWRTEENKKDLQDQLHQATQTIQATVPAATANKVEKAVQ